MTLALSQEQALLRAVLERPSEDGPRLRYADWLEENGQAERGEFIRVQIELAGPYDKVHPSAVLRRTNLLVREQELLSAHKHDWLDNVTREATIFGGATPEHVSKHLLFRRGFIDSLACTCSDWLRWGPEIVGQQPVTTVVLTDRWVMFAPPAWKPNQSPLAWAHEQAGLGEYTP
jgi:uncharacterized protein (TIGR02996 family)